MRKAFIAALVLSVLGGVALAQEAKEPSSALEQRLQRVEQAMARLEAKLNDRRSGGAMMEGCREMMGGGMMGGGMGGMHGGDKPNEQWRSPGPKH